VIPFVDVVRVESGRFADAVAAVDAAAPVPTCPGWTAADLIWHLTEVQDFWGKIVAGGIEDPTAVQRIDRPPDEGLREMFAQRSEALVAALADRDAAESCWTWSSDRTVGFVQRRQAHEALIHRVDAEMAAQRPLTPFNSDLAGDGIDEILRVMIGGPPEWGEFAADGTTVRIEAADAGVAGTTWGLAFGRFSGTEPSSGVAYDVDAATVGIDTVEVDAVIRGAAADVDRWLWGRGPLDSLKVLGDRRQADRLRALAAETTR
jgi:uncharacterized protein (TIGR03083 family)